MRIVLLTSASALVAASPAMAQDQGYWTQAPQPQAVQHQAPQHQAPQHQAPAPQWYGQPAPAPQGQAYYSQVQQAPQTHSQVQGAQVHARPGQGYAQPQAHQQYQQPGYYQPSTQPDLYSAQTSHAPGQQHHHAVPQTQHYQQPAPTQPVMRTPQPVAPQPAPALRRGDGTSFQVFGRAQIDATYAQSDFDDPLGISPQPDAKDDSFSSELRRAWVGVQGVAGAVGYKAEIGFQTDEVEFQDVYVEFKSTLGSLFVGQRRVPNTLAFGTANTDTTSLERPEFVRAFGFDRQLGVSFATDADNYALQAALFTDNLRNDGPAIDFRGESDDEAYGASLRGTYALINQPGQVLHLGGSLRYRQEGQTQGFCFEARPGANLVDPFLTCPQFTESDVFYGLEGAFVRGPFHIAGEYGLLNTDFDTGEAADFTGAYLEAGYFLTGESRAYDASQGIFGRTTPNANYGEGGIGALELRGRVDFVDFSDTTIFDGQQTVYSAGLNWYLNERVKVLGEYAFADVEAAQNDFGALGDGEVNSLNARLQFDW